MHAWSLFAQILVFDGQAYYESNMNVLTRIKGALRGATQRWGTSKMKRGLWNKEFTVGRWESLECSANDSVYPYVEKYCCGGDILDLGCGSGNTGCELNPRSYENYVGVDISDVALEKARRRSETCQRGKKNQYVQSCISAYVPDAKYNVILFRESIYYIPRRQIMATFERYSGYLKEEGVLIVRWHDKAVAEDLLKLISGAFKVVEQFSSADSGPVVLIFRPRAGMQNLAAGSL